MLFMDIWTWEPEKRDEMVKRAAEWKCPTGMKELGYWVDLTGNRVFSLYEVEDPAVLLEANNYWTDIAKCESVPVMEMEEVMKLMPKSQNFCKTGNTKPMAKGCLGIYSDGGVVGAFDREG